MSIEEMCKSMWHSKKNKYKDFSPYLLRKHYNFSVLLNIFAFCLFWHFTKSYVALVIGAIIFDALMITVDYLLFDVYYVKVKSNMTLDKQKKYIDYLHNELEKLDDYIDNADNNYYAEKIYRSLRDYYETQVEDYKSKLDKIEKERIKANTSTSKDYSDKREYFKNVIKKLEIYSDDFDLNCLDKMRNSLVLLCEVLDEKPVGYALIRESLYIHLDELQSILLKLSSTDEQTYSVYKDSLIQVIKLLQNNIDDLITRIKKYETDDIEISLNVLLNDLSKSDDKRE